MNDPYGNRFEPGYGTNNGQGILYEWKRATARRALEVIGVYPPPPIPPRPTRTPTPIPTQTPVTTATPTSTPVQTATATPPAEGTTDPLSRPSPGIILTAGVTGEPVEKPVEEVSPIPTYDISLPGSEPTPDPTPTVEEPPTPEPTLTPESLFYTLPLVLSALAIVAFRRSRKG